MSQAQIVERVEKDLETIRQIIYKEIKERKARKSSGNRCISERDVISNNPLKNGERSHSKRISSFMNGANSFGGNTENGHGKMLRSRRNRIAVNKYH